MSEWLTILRFVDGAALGVASGFTLALWYRLGGLGVDWPLRVARAFYLVSYILLSFGTMAEIEHAIRTGEPVSWRTGVVTLAAATATLASWWTWFHWRGIQNQMTNGLPKRKRE